MKSLTEIDNNFDKKMSIDMTGKTAYDVCEDPFRIYGVIPPKSEEDVFKRMPEDVAKKVNDGVEILHFHTAGGRIRFATNSKYVAIHAELNKVIEYPYLEGKNGFDMYEMTDEGEKFRKFFAPPIDPMATYEGEYEFKTAEMREITINMPLYCGVKRLYIILNEDAELRASGDYTYEKPIVYYGSSITQGANASRPGTNYLAIISRRFDTDFVNLGFSGNAYGEPEMAQYLAGLDMSICVMDYDHNAPTVEHLRDTHHKMYEVIRKANPDLPIICVSKPNFYFETVKCDLENNIARRQVIIDSVNLAKEKGDKNIYFVDGKEFASVFGAGDNMIVDGCHPNDIGFLSMAKLIGDCIGEIIKK